MTQPDASRSESPRQLLGDITESAHSQANVVRHNAYKSTSPIDVNYYQQQYHSAVLQDAINVHAQYMQLQEQGLAAQAFLLQQQLMAQVAQQQMQPMPQQQQRGARKGASPNPRSSPRTTTSRRASPVHHHGDDESSPCDCPDCNMRRLQEVMTETATPSAYAPTSRRFVPPMRMDFDAMMAMNMYAQQQHINSPLMRGGSMPTSPLMNANEAMLYGMPAYDQMPAPSVTKHNPYAPHSPTSVPTNVGYEVPYIPARGDYAHYAMEAPNSEPSREASTDESLEEGEREIPTGKSAPKKEEVTPVARRSAPPKPSPKQPARRPSPTLMDQLSAEAQLAAMTQAASTPTQSRQQTNSRRTSPKDNTPNPHHTHAHHAAPSTVNEPCPFLLRLKVSQWHQNVPVAASENLPVGTYVKFEGDRGEDMGCVVSCTELTVEDTANYPRVRARASTPETESHLASAADAATTVPAAQAAVDRAGLHMRVVGAVYQFNREKLTFMYESNERIDFRQLVRDLYALFRCRIWMEPVPTTTSPNSKPNNHHGNGKRTGSPINA